MPKFNLKVELVSYEGTVMTEPRTPGPDFKPGDTIAQDPITIRQVISAAIRREIAGKPTTPEDKQRIYEINKKIWKKWSVDLTHAECEFIMSRAKETLDDLMMGRLDDFLEGRDWDLPTKEPEVELAGSPK
jgi:hypothetical protein